MGDALRLMAENHIGGIPVVDEQNYLIGIVTNRDLRFQDDHKRPIAEVMTSENLITVSPNITIPQATEVLSKHRIEKLPVIDENNKLVGLITYRDIMKIKKNPTASKDSRGRLLAAAAVGINSHSVEDVEKLVSVGIDAVVLDTAHGHFFFVLQTIKKIREAFPHLQIVAGNIVTQKLRWP